MEKINEPKKAGFKNRDSMVSLILAIVPIIIILSGFLFCLILSGGQTSDNDMGAVWWLFIALLGVMIPTTLVANIIAIVFGIKGIRKQKTLLAWAGIIIVIFEASAITLTAGVAAIRGYVENRGRNQEILQMQDAIKNYETYADLTPFGLGLYKLQYEGDKHLWDITKPEDYVIEFEGVEMVFEHHYNRKDEESWDNDWKNSNKGKDVTYDVYFYEDTYLIVTPLWDEPGTLYYWGYVYLCKDISENADLFNIGIHDPKLVENFKMLPVVKMSRKELSEKLGKAF